MPDAFNMSDVMISYSRKDKPFVVQLEQALRTSGREVWIDWEDIPVTVDFWKEICAGIEGADTFIFIISPDSIRSKVCGDELAHAIKHNKRIIPVLRRLVTEPDDQQRMNPVIAGLNWIYFREEDDFQQAFTSLIQGLEVDVDHVRLHTRLLVRANEWNEKNRGGSLLLRGDDLREAETWLAAGLQRQPAPTALQGEYITASRRAANRFRQIVAGAMAAALVILSVMAVIAVAASQQAQSALGESEQRGTALVFQVSTANSALTQSALEGQIRATAQAKAIEEADARATQAQLALDSAATARFAQGMAQDEADNAATQAQAAQDNAATATVARGQAQIEAGNARRSAAQAVSAQQTAEVEAANAQTQAANAQTQAALATIAQGEAEQKATAAAISEATAEAEANRARAQALANGSQAALAEGNRPLAMQRALLAVELQSDLPEAQSALYEAIYSTGLHGRFSLPADTASANPQAGFSADGKRALADPYPPGGDDVIAWDVATGLRVTPQPGDAASGPITTFDDGRYHLEDSGSLIMAMDNDNNPVTRFSGHTANINSMTISGDQQLLLSGSDDGTVRLWHLHTGRAVQRFTGHTQPVTSVAFSPDGRQGISISRLDGTVRIWDLQSPVSLNDIRAFLGEFLAVSADGRFVLYRQGTSLGDIVLYNQQSGASLTLTGGKTNLFGSAFSPDSKRLLYGGYVWNTATGEQIQAIGADVVNGSDGPGAIPVFSPDGKRILSGSYDAVYLWDVATGEKIEFRDDGEPPQNLAFSPDGKIGLFVRNNILERWDLDPDSPTYKQRIADDGARGVSNAPFVPFKGTQIIIGLSDGTLRLWDTATDTTLKTFLGHTSGIVSLALNSDQSLLVSSSLDGAVRVWDMNTRQTVAIVRPVDVAVAVGFTPDSRQIFTLSIDSGRVTQLWDLPDLSGGIQQLVKQTCAGYVLPELSEAEINRLGLDSGDGCQEPDTENSGGEQLESTPTVVETLEAEATAEIPSGAWMSISDGRAGGGSYWLSTRPNSEPITLNFTGTGIDVTFAKSTLLGMFDIEIDGIVMQTVDSAANAGEAYVFGERTTIDGLPNSAHTLRILPQNQLVAIDGFETHAEATLEATAEVTEAITEAAIEATSESSPEVLSALAAGGWVRTDEGWYISAGDGFLDFGESIDLALPRQFVFRSLLSAPAGGSLAAVQVSTDNGVTWTLAETALPSETWQEVAVDLTPYVGQTALVRLMWLYTPPAEGQVEDYWLVDDLAVSDRPTPMPTVEAAMEATVEISAESTSEILVEPTPTALEISPSETPFVPNETPFVATETPFDTPEMLTYHASDGSTWMGADGWTLGDNGEAIIFSAVVPATFTRQESIQMGGELRFTSTLNAPTENGSVAIVEISVGGGEWQPAQLVQLDESEVVVDLTPYTGQSIGVRLIWYYVPPLEGALPDFWSVGNLRIIEGVTPTTEFITERTAEPTIEPITQPTAEATAEGAGEFTSDVTENTALEQPPTVESVVPEETESRQP